MIEVAWKGDKEDTNKVWEDDARAVKGTGKTEGRKKQVMKVEESKHSARKARRSEGRRGKV